MADKPEEEPMETETTEPEHRSQENMDVQEVLPFSGSGGPPHHAPSPPHGSPAPHGVVTSQPSSVPPTIHSDRSLNSETPGPVARLYPSQDVYRTQELPAADPSAHISGAPDTGPGAPQTHTQDGPAAGRPPQASAPLDQGQIYIRVDATRCSPETLSTFNRKNKLEKALQTWANGTPLGPDREKWSVVSVQLMNDGTSAALVITPASAVQELLKLRSADLTSKDLEVNVQFSQDEPRRTEAVERGSAPAGVNVEASVPDPVSTASMPSASESNLTIPPFQFLYLNQAYRAELACIQERFGVEIKAEVLVSFALVRTHTAGDPVEEAARTFSDLYLRATKDIRSIPIPESQRGRGLDEHLSDLTDEDRKLCVMCGSMLMAPEPTATRVQRLLNSSEVATGPGSGSPKLTDGAVEFDVEGAPVSLEMDDTHWSLVQKTYDRQLSEIKTKYGVSLHTEPSPGSVRVAARANGAHGCRLETHAIRALTRLYQKVATSTVYCSLRDQPGPEALEILRRYPVEALSRSGTPRLAGRVQDVVHAVHDVEKRLGRSVIDARTWERLGSPSGYPLPGWGGDEAHGVAQKNGEKKKEEEKEEEEKCPICLDSFTDKKKLRCGHGFCKDCVEKSVESIGKICPMCKEVFGVLRGTQPDGTMRVDYRNYTKIPGYLDSGTIEINYHIPDGIQGAEHPNPGRPYRGTSRTAFLPSNAEGKHVLTLLRKAFDQRLIFTVGTSRTSGLDNAVIWNDVHHKTNMTGGPQSFGYPDPEYLNRVKDELKAKGIV